MCPIKNKPNCCMVPFLLLGSLLVLLRSLVGGVKADFYLNIRQETIYNDKSSCPEGYRLAQLDDPEDWEKATKLALESLGHEKSVWIRYGLGWRGVGNERWSIITPKKNGSCPFPPKDLESFCVPLRRPKLSPNWHGKRLKLPSICEKIV